MNSRRLKAEYIRALSASLELLTRVSPNELRQVIKGKLTEDGNEPHNVQVFMQELRGTEHETHAPVVRLFLVNDRGVVHETETVGQQARIDRE